MGLSSLYDKSEVVLFGLTCGHMFCFLYTVKPNIVLN